MSLKRGGDLIMKKSNLFVTRSMSQQVWLWYSGCVVYAGYVYIMTTKTRETRHAEMKY